LGPIEKYLRKEIKKDGTICIALIDSENISPSSAINIAVKAERSGVKGIFVGGSTAIDQIELDLIVKSIKSKVKIPIILFPGNVTGVSPNADAILFSSLLNSENPYFITEAQALGALSIKKYNLEAIPMGYIIIGDAGSTGFIGRARGIPPNKPQLASMYALATQYFGMRFIYLEAGSGVTSHVSEKLVHYVRKSFNGILIVGGGIKDIKSSILLSKSGADILVLGTLLEKSKFETILKNIVNKIKH
jgi:phosphoglycerol geranylgeranyltransferase